MWPNRYADCDAAMDESMTRYINWMVFDNLMLTTIKTVLIISTWQQPAKVNINSARVCSTDVCPVPVASLMARFTAHCVLTLISEIVWSYL